MDTAVAGGWCPGTGLQSDYDAPSDMSPDSNKSPAKDVNTLGE